MRLSEVFVQLGEQRFGDLVRRISIGKLRTYQLYESFKTRAHLGKVNTETLRKAAPRLWARVQENDEDLAKDTAQAILLTHFDMVKSVLDFLGIPNEDGFFAKDLDASSYLTDGWQQRVYDKFHGAYPEPAILLYVNHLAWELEKEPQLFKPAS
ncbi:MAG TPA: hypothetical protein VLE22_03290 [Bryobacteraceae bacterium]|nr:hypothetical protein [Bryobacteraceae bacterium]